MKLYCFLSLLLVFGHSNAQIISVLHVNFEKAKANSFMISNSLGQIMQMGKSIENNTIKISGLSNGLYFLNVQTDSCTIVRKFLKN